MCKVMAASPDGYLAHARCSRATWTRPNATLGRWRVTVSTTPPAALIGGFGQVRRPTPPRRREWSGRQMTNADSIVAGAGHRQREPAARSLSRSGEPTTSPLGTPDRRVEGDWLRGVSTESMPSPSQVHCLRMDTPTGLPRRCHHDHQARLHRRLQLTDQDLRSAPLRRGGLSLPSPQAGRGHDGRLRLRLLISVPHPPPSRTLSLIDVTELGARSHPPEFCATPHERTHRDQEPRFRHSRRLHLAGGPRAGPAGQWSIDRHHRKERQR
jgi:hypothetical protein